MPGLRIATASGNWSSTSTWVGGLLPAPGDSVCSNGFTVAIDQSINVGLLTNTAQTDTGATVVMTSDTTPTGYIAAISSNNGTAAFNAFRKDGNNSTWLASGNPPAWISYQFPSPIVINRYSILGTSTLGRNPNTWTFEGSNDGVTWTVLHTVTNSTIAASTWYNSPLIGNTTSYTRYRVNVSAIGTVGQSVSIAEIYLYELNYDSLTNAVAGGGFTCGASCTITLTETSTTTGALIGTSVLRWTGGSGITTNINAVVIREYNFTLLVQGTGTLNLTSNLRHISQNDISSVISVTGNCTFNIVGSLTPLAGGNQSEQASLISLSSACTLNITGDLISTSGVACCIRANTVSATGATINITGNLTNSSNLGFSGNQIILNAAATVNITGNCSGRVLNSAVAHYLKVIGSIAASNFNGLNSIIATSTSAINIFTGPFICASYGSFPLQVTRMHLIPTLNNYFEFRDDSTNGALSPGAIAPATRLVSPDTIIDAPTANNVRLGVSYGNGAYTGTCAIPSASNVALNVPFDISSVGTAYISASDITDQVWGSLVSNLNTPNSIGEKLKNASTVATTGAQIAALS